ncbi:proteasome assembly chaperone family protein [Arthrobacter sp. 08Y14]|uniref:proteasome assembly chaperone family protein n=1 Tax=Arthrobacter sp. 08Y14 TaxID=2058885 RepID=UPI000CE485E9|nr:PAC2 family protein [Arthrobacter sp. 08Y14]
MLDPLTLFNLNPEVADDAALHGLQLLVGFTGFAEAGHVVSQIRDELLENLEHDVVASFDSDQLIDYRARRPQISFVEDHLADYEPPQLNLYRMYDGLGEPFLFLTGFEPDVQWERFAAAVVHLARTFDVKMMSWIHSIPMPVPHTRPVGVTVHGNRPDLMAGISAWRPQAQIQAAVGHVLELRLTQAGFDVVGHAMHVPHYLAEAEFPPAAVAGLEYLGAAASLVLPTDRLREAGRDVERQIAQQVEASAEVKGVVATLEKRYDEYAESTVRRSLLVKDNDELADAEELGAAVEAYLASPQAEEESEALRPETTADTTEDAETGGNADASGQAETSEQADTSGPFDQGTGPKN